MELKKLATLKIKRTDEAKEFPLMHASKPGDVGLDIPACLPLDDTMPAQCIEFQRDRYKKDEITEQDFIDFIHKPLIIYPGCRGVIPTGISLEIPYGYWASIEPRSSTSKYMIEVPKGIIDEGYRGELFAVLINVGNEPVTIHHGERWVQLILHERVLKNISIQEVDELAPSQRGDSGFGSTGRR